MSRAQVPSAVASVDEEAPAPPPGAPRPSAGESLATARKLLRKAGAFPALVLVLVVGAFLSPFFLTADNMVNVVETAAVIGLLAVGQGFVIIAGGAGIDLSVGAALAFAAVVGARMAPYGPVGVVGGAILGGLFIGLINGLGVAIARIQPFIMTLGTMTIASGAAYYLSASNQIRLSGADALPWLTSSVFGIPVPILVFAAAVVLGQLLLGRTVFGRQIYVMGGNEEAAHFAGIPVARRRMAVYLISGLCAGVAALLLVSRLTTADPNYGAGYELACIAAVVVGGAPLTGGVGTIRGVAIGVLVIELISNLLDIMNVNPHVQLMVKGLIVIVVVSLNRRGAMASGQTIRASFPLAIALVVGAAALFGVFGG
ncbi:ABC transporter permease [Pseudonocardia sp. H11422]|uniref:ABC transporter permease n=1 Tax=Pseudonocardia sp. H11422 TaxID=2835866 RepID=UPI001BDC7061|nr:ABC transporter permease [Pseudonocardia sp. H11422]